METDRYNGHRRGELDVNGMALALGATAALLFGLTLTAPHFTKPIETILTGTNIPIDPPPPPKPEPQPQPRDANTPSNPRPDFVDTSHPPVDGPPTGFPPVPAEPAPNPGPIAGTGTDVAPTIPQPVHVPVELVAKLDSRYADTFQPEYPAGERTAEHEGRVVVRVLIGTDGRVKAVEQVSAASAAFFEATRKRALAKWRFVPATRDGVAIESWQRIGVSFNLESE